MNTTAGKVSLILNIVLVCACVVLAVIYFVPSTHNLYGTYCTGDGVSTDDVYLVLQKDGVYALYKQFEPLEKGHFTVVHASKDADVLNFAAENGSDLLDAVCSSDEVFLLGAEQGDLAFKKVSNDAMYVNVPGMGAPPSATD